MTIDALTDSERVSLETLAHALQSAPDQATFDERLALLVKYVDGVVANAGAHARGAAHAGADTHADAHAHVVVDGAQG